MPVEIKAKFQDFSRCLILKNRSNCATAWIEATTKMPILHEARQVTMRVMGKDEVLPTGCFCSAAFIDYGVKHE